jgi:hypothetical protein
MIQVPLAFWTSRRHGAPRDYRAQCNAITRDFVEKVNNDQYDIFPNSRSARSGPDDLWAIHLRAVFAFVGVPMHTHEVGTPMNLALEDGSAITIDPVAPQALQFGSVGRALEPAAHRE